MLSRKTGFTRAYGRNPYTGYDDIRSIPFLYRGPKDDRLPPMERVVAVTIGKSDKAYPYSVLSKKRVVHDKVGGRDIVVFHSDGAASALDGSSIADSRDVGATGVFEPEPEREETDVPIREGRHYGQGDGKPLGHPGARDQRAAQRQPADPGSPRQPLRVFMVRLQAGDEGLYALNPD